MSPRTLLIALALSAGLALTHSPTFAQSGSPPAETPHAPLEASVSDILDRMVREMGPDERLALTPETAAAFLNAEERERPPPGFARFTVDRAARLFVASDSD